MINLLVIVGPTAVGKTGISIEIAKKLNGEIISADSMQIYKYMNIGTAKPSISERQGIAHHMIDIISPDEEFSVALYKNMAQDVIKDISARQKLPILTGGTGLYINSIINKMDFSSHINWNLRNALKKTAGKMGNEFLYKKLREIDPKTSERLHPNDIRRIIRAIEVYTETGKPISYFQEHANNVPNPAYHPIMIGLTMDRELLYRRIEIRVDSMIKSGLIDEVKWLCLHGYRNNMISMQAIGYKEILKYIDGEITLEDAVDLLKKDTRHYAKRQMTWFKKDKRIKWIDLTDHTNPVNLILELVAKNLKLI